MEKLRSNKSKLLSFGALGAIGMAVLAGCANTSGEGNDFAIKGKVVTVGERSLTLAGIQVLDARGDAKGWFDDNKEHQVHDNYRNDDCHIKTVGHEYTAAGVPEELANISVGDVVELDGKIRDSYHDCRPKSHPYHERPVFDKLVEVATK